MELFGAIELEDFDLLKKIIESRDVDLNKRDRDYDTPLIRACKKQCVEIIKYLCEQGADLDRRDFFEYTAIMRACELGSLEIVSYLISRGATTICCAYVAAQYGHLDILKLLSSKGVNLNEIVGTSEYWWMPLLIAAKKGLCNIVDFLLSEGCSIEHENVSALSIACKYGHVDIIDKFLEIGCDVNFKHDPPILQAIHSNNIAIVNKLIISGVDVNGEYPYHHYALSKAIFESSYEMIMHLLKIGADVNKCGGTFTNYDLACNLFNHKKPDAIRIANLIYKEQMKATI